MQQGETDRGSHEMWSGGKDLGMKIMENYLNGSTMVDTVFPFQVSQGLLTPYVQHAHIHRIRHIPLPRSIIYLVWRCCIHVPKFWHEAMHSSSEGNTPRPLHCIPQLQNRITIHRAVTTERKSRSLTKPTELSSLPALSMGTQRFVQCLHLPYS